MLSYEIIWAPDCFVYTIMFILSSYMPTYTTYIMKINAKCCENFARRKF